MTKELTEAELVNMERRAAKMIEYGDHAYCSVEAVVSDDDMPALIAEVRRLQHQLALVSDRERHGAQVLAAARDLGEGEDNA